MLVFALSTAGASHIQHWPILRRLMGTGVVEQPAATNSKDVLNVLMGVNRYDYIICGHVLAYLKLKL